MEYETITEKQWRVIQSGGGEIPRIKERAQLLIRNFATLFNNLSPGDITGVLVTQPDAESMGSVASPFGEGRFTFSLTHHDEEIMGHIAVERKSRDKHDNLIWEPVWGVFVPTQGVPFSGDGNDRSSYKIYAEFHDDATDATFRFGMKVLYALVKTR